MTLQNRVLPTGEIVAENFRGGFMGNRGRIHTPEKQLGPSRWKCKAWIICVLCFKDRQRDELMAPRSYTELFFLDEATAMAAGHRPCAECRRAAYNCFRDLWREVVGTPATATEIDKRMHEDRVTGKRVQKRYEAHLGDLPDGCFVRSEGADWLLWKGRMLRVSSQGYVDVEPTRLDEVATVLTPACTVRVLSAGYKPALHASTTALLES